MEIGGKFLRQVLPQTKWMWKHNLPEATTRTTHPSVSWSSLSSITFQGISFFDSWFCDSSRDLMEATKDKSPLLLSMPGSLMTIKTLHQPFVQTLSWWKLYNSEHAMKSWWKVHSKTIQSICYEVCWKLAIRKEEKHVSKSQVFFENIGWIHFKCQEVQIEPSK